MRKRPSVNKGKAADWPGSERHEHWLVSAGVLASARMEDGRCGNTGSPVGAVHATTGTPQGAGWAGRVAERPVVLKTRGNARRGKGPQVWRDAKRVQACGSGFGLLPRVYKGGKKESRGITCRSEGVGPTAGGRLGAVRA